MKFLKKSYFLFIFFFISSLIILINKEFYLIPFIKNIQESNPSMASYLFAYGNIYRDDLNFLIPRYLNCNLDIIASDAFWFNTYYLLFTPFVKIFGTDYIIGRLFPIFLNTVGLFLIFKANTNNRLLILSSLILLFCSTFKDSFAFNFHDSLILFLIGSFLYLKKINSNYYLLTSFVIFSILSLHYIIIFFIFFFIFDENISKKKKIFLLSVLLIFSTLILFSFYNYLNFENFILNINKKLWFFDLNFITGKISEDSLIRMIYLFYAEIRDNLGFISLILYSISFFYFYVKRKNLFYLNISSILFYLVFAKQVIPHNFMMMFFLTICFLQIILLIDDFLKNKKIKILFYLVIFINIIYINFQNPTVYNMDSNLVEIYQDENKTISSSDLQKDKIKLYHKCYFFIENIINNRELKN